jgi:hypothetical protein
MGAWFNDTPLWILLLLLFVGLLLAREIGAWISLRATPSDMSDDTSRGYILSGVLGLLALLIAFTFGLALERYQTRRDLVVAEANAIGTAEMRVRLMDPPYSIRLSGLLRDYAETRLKYAQASAAERPALQRASADMRNLIQTEALRGLRPVRNTPVAVLVTPAINETLDIGAAREAAHKARIPMAVVFVLVVYALVSAAVLGAALKEPGRSHRAMTALMFLLLTLAFGVILDLDRSRTGAITISQDPMAALVQSLRTAPPVEAERQGS